MKYIDAFVFITLGPISLCSSLFIIFTFYKYKEMREQPGDIFLWISISELILAIHWIN